MSTINQAIESRTVRKTMIRILPFILLLYFIAYLDRVNLGYAALAMNADLALSAEGFGLLSGIFFIGYFFFEVPSNIIMHKVGAKLWIARIMITWGLITVLTGFVETAMHLYIMRFLLGVAEAGFFPGILLYFTYWFRSKEKSRASASLILALPIGTIVGAPISTWIMGHITWNDMAGWRWMFVLEGIPAIVLGVVTLFYLSNRPKDAKWLTDEEKNWLEDELEKERSYSRSVNKPSKLAMFKDSNIWKLSIVFFANYSAMYGLAFWLPSIIKSLSQGSTYMDIGWLSIIPALVGIPSMLFWAWRTDRSNSHKKYLIASFIVAATGFIMCGFANSAATMIAMLAIAAIGLYGFSGSFFSYLTLFFTESTAPVGIATVNSLASIGGFIGPMIFGVLKFSNGMFLLASLAIIGSLIVLTIKQKETTELTVQGVVERNAIGQ